MKDKRKIKEQLLKACEGDIEKRIQSIRALLDSLEESRNNETKSSVGDKYETGRSIIQIEEEKNKNRLFQAFQAQQELSRIDSEKICQQVETGSLVQTNTGNYFIAIALGKIKLEDITYYCISINAPIGMQLKGHRAGDEIIFNNRNIKIIEIG